MDNKLNDFKASITKYLSKKEVASLMTVFDFSNEAHKGQLRSSGQPFISHPLEVAFIVAELEQDYETIAAALLHDTVEDSDVSTEDVASKFGQKIAELVNGVSKIGQLSFDSKEEQQAENYRKMIVAMAKDIRVIIVKLADRTHNMRTLKHLPKQKQLRIAQETRDIYAPLANRLGMATLKWELEDLCFYYLEYDEFQKIKKMVVSKRKERESYIKTLVKSVEKLLVEASIDAQIFGRPKHFYSIYKKLSSQAINFDQLFDMLGIRILVESVRDCYVILGLLHSTYKPVHGRFKDYIAVPKSNMYQSLHTTVLALDGKPVEMQIRTKDMDQIAEFGVAAHWTYKEGQKSSDAKDEFTWLRQMVDLQKEKSNSKDFLNDLKYDLFMDEVFTYTPKGDVIVMSAGATVIDFAYYIHTEIGHCCSGGKVNGQMVPINHVLENGDQVDILTSKNNKPHIDWLNFAASRQARSKIKAWFKRQSSDILIKKGEEKLSQIMLTIGYPLKEVLKNLDMSKVLDRFHVKDINALYLNIGQGELSSMQVGRHITKLMGLKDNTKVTPSKVIKPARTLKKSSQSAVTVFGQLGVLYTLAKCCKPLPGDDIEGIVTIEKGVSVHQSKCRNILNLSESTKERLVPVEWDSLQSEASFTATLQIEAFERIGILEDIISRISASNLNMVNLNSKILKGGTVMRMLVVVEVKNAEAIKILGAQIKQVSDVVSIKRV
ncbi:(p)ppGpp synthetase [Candidatus Marinamargulisbacteria bacterium SCGC AAA071-K20]|nr:(p)ppGpp synthetase [Candidatus Marinamargulisbacteria bacterium SCGC AAA071-K20]